MSIFGKFLEEVIPEIDNKEVRKLVEQNMERFRGEVNLKLETLKVIGNGFSVKDYLRAKAKALIDAPKVKIKAKRAGAEKWRFLLIYYIRSYMKLFVLGGTKRLND